MNEVRLRHHLQLQATAIEAVFARQGWTAQVEGGDAGDDSTSYLLRVTKRIRPAALNQLRQELRRVLRVPAVHLRQRGKTVLVEVCHPAPALNLLELLETVGPLPPATMLLGWLEEERPLLVSLAAEDTAHVLIAGDRGAGKTALLRTCVLSLAQRQRQADVQMIFMAPAGSAGGGALRPFSYLPHALGPVVTTPGETAEILDFLVRECDYRTEQVIRRPRIVLFADDFAALLDAGDAATRRAIHTLLQRGAGAGIHLVAAAEGVGTPALADALPALFPVRLVGRIADAAAATMACGTEKEVDARRHAPRGAFLVVAGEVRFPFTAALVDDYDLHLCLQQVQRLRRPALLAQPLVPPAAETVQGFAFDGDAITLLDEGIPALLAPEVVEG